MDAAFLDRWYSVYIDYDPFLEAHLCGKPMPNIPSWQKQPKENFEREWPTLSSWVLTVRKKIREQKIKKTWGTRTLIKARTALQAGLTVKEIQQDLLLGWPPDLISLVVLPPASASK